MLEEGSAVHRRVRAAVPSEGKPVVRSQLLPCRLPSAEPGILSRGPQKILKPFNSVRVGALRLL